MSPFTLTVPATAPFRGLAPEVAGKYAELAGGTAADGTALATAVTDALDKLTAAAPGAATIELRFHPDSAGVEIAMRCGDRSAALRHPLLAGKQ